MGTEPPGRVQCYLKRLLRVAWFPPSIQGHKKLECTTGKWPHNIVTQTPPVTSSTKGNTSSLFQATLPSMGL